MKILLTGFPTMGGSGMITTRLGLELAELGHDIHFLFYKRPFFLKDSDRKANITFHQVERLNYALFKDIGSPFTIQSASKMAKVIREEKIDIVHSHYAIPHAVSSYLASKMTSVKTVVTTHGSDVHTLGNHEGYNETISLALKETNLVTSVSNFLARKTEKVYNLQENSVPVIYDFVNTDQFKPMDNEREFSLIQASNFRPVKQIPLLVEMFAKIADNFPNWKLKLVGDGPEVTTTLRKTRQMKVRDQVEFLGVQRKIPEIFAKSSILVSSSRIESFGLTIAEAMACGTPVWAPYVGGIPELCEDGVTGYLYDLENKDEAVEKLASMMEDEVKRKKMGIAARKRVLENFSIDIIIKQYEDKYRSILDN